MQFQRAFAFFSLLLLLSLSSSERAVSTIIRPFVEVSPRLGFFIFYFLLLLFLRLLSAGWLFGVTSNTTCAFDYCSLLGFIISIQSAAVYGKARRREKKSHIKIYEISILTSFHFSTSKQRNFFSVTIWALFSWASVQLGQSLHVDSTFSRVCCLWLLLHFSQYFISPQHLIWAAPASVEVFTSPPLWTVAQLKEVNLRSR